MKGREYKLRHNAEKRLRQMQAMYPARRFWIAPTQNFKFAIYTAKDMIPADDPNAIAIVA